MYFQVTLKESTFSPKLNSYHITFKGETTEVEFSTVRFYASSLDEAKSFFDANQIEEIRILQTPSTDGHD